MKNSKSVVVIGGGPAGMLAAISAARSGAQVFLLEKNNQLGEKLALTGGGRCNLSNQKISALSAPKIYGLKKGRFLASSLRQFDRAETIKFFEKLGLKFNCDRTERLIPKSEKACDVIQALEKELTRLNVKIIYSVEVEKIVAENNIFKKVIYSGQELGADKCILACGGQTYPQTGSTGDGYIWASELGHQVIEPKTALVALTAKETWLQTAQGLGIEEVILKSASGKKYSGNLMLAHFGISASAAFDFSRENFDFPQIIKIDFLPQFSETELRQNALKYLTDKLGLARYFKKFLPKRLVEIFFELADLDLLNDQSQVSKIKIAKLLVMFKHNPVTLTGILNAESGMVTAGGVSLKEVNPNTLESRLIKNLYFAGELLDLDGPTGGYNLQIAWSTGYVAGLTPLQSSAAGFDKIKKIRHNELC